MQRAPRPGSPVGKVAVEATPSIADRTAQAQRPRLFPWVLLSAALMTAAFPPLDLGFLAWVALAPLFYAIPLARRARHAFVLGYLFGCVHWGWTVTWIGTTVVNWAQTDWGWLAWVLLTLIKSLWFGLFAALAWWIGRKTAGAACTAATAAGWTLIEWLRTQTGIAMPWSLIGYTQWHYLPMIQIADLTGVYGISFVLAAVNAALMSIVRDVRATGFAVLRRWGESAGRLKAGTSVGLGVGRPLFVAAALSAAVLLYGGIALTHTYHGVPLRVAMMQPNIRSERGGPDSTAHDLALFHRMGAEVAASRPDLIIWPETIAPGDVLNDAEDRKTFAGIARQAGAWELVGTSHFDESGGEHNSAALFDPDGALVDRYDKQWLVPFGEWIPARNVLPFGDVFHFPARDVVPGKRKAPILAGPARLAVLICYESVFPIVSRSRAAAGANLLVNITNDSWAGRSKELAQHFAMTVLRAVETRRYAVSVATTGVTGLIGPDGRYAVSPPYRESTFVADASLLEGETAYVRFGDWLIALCGIGIVWVLLRRGPEAPLANRKRS